MIFGFDPYNTLDEIRGQGITHTVRATYHGPLTAVAYRDQRYWDFAPGCTSAAKLAALQGKAWRNETPAFLKRQAN